MAGMTLVIDPDGTSLTLQDPANGWRLTGFDAPAPELDTQWASSADTEGERRAGWRFTNRTITAKVLISKSSNALLEAAENLLGQAVGKLQRDGGELELGYPSGETITFDVLQANLARTYDPGHVGVRLAEYTLTFVCLPLGLGAEVTLSDHAETTLPVLIFTEADIPGDVPARVRLVVDEDATAEQNTVLWGFQGRHYDAASTAALFYQAEALTGTTAVGPAGASGSGSNTIYEASLATGDPSSIATLSGATHVGSFRALVRVQAPVTNTGTVSVQASMFERLGVGVVRDPVEIDPGYEGTWRIVDLGQLTMTEPTNGSQSVQITIGASSTVAGDDIYLDWLILLPVDDGWGEVRGNSAGGAMPADGQVEFTSTGVSINRISVWDDRPTYEGDYPLAPPSGPESRTLRVLVKGSRGRIVGDPELSAGDGADGGTDDISAQLFVTPRYLVLPAA